MITINLLPKKEVRRETTLVKHGIIASISLLVALIVLFLCSAKIKTKINLIDNQTTTIKSELAELKENKKKIEELKVSEAIFQKKIDVIKKLEKRKIGPVKILDEIATIIPEKMWLNELKSQKTRLCFDGVAIDNETIAFFMTNLENSDQFNDVELKVAQEIEVDDYMLKNFSLTCNVKAMQEIEEEASSEDGNKEKNR